MSLNKCKVCNKLAENQCGHCRNVSYCSAKCQAKDWHHLGHSLICNELGASAKPKTTPFYILNIKETTLGNNELKKTIVKTPNMQLAVEHVMPNKVVGPETHDVDQFIVVVAGSAKIKVADQTFDLKRDDAIVVPANTQHTVTAKDHLRFYTIYA